MLGYCLNDSEACMASKELAKRKAEAMVEKQLRAQHAMHGLLFDVYEEIGGFNQMTNWARENQTDFYRLFIKSTPNLIPVQGNQGEVEIHVHPSLQPTELDGEYEVVEDSTDNDDVDA